MKVFAYFMLGIFLVVSCTKEDEPVDYSGVYKSVKLRSECTESSKNVSRDFDAGTSELCNTVTGGQDCISLTITLKTDLTYTLQTKTREIRANGGLVITKPATDNGTYTVVDQTLTLCTASNSCLTLKATGVAGELDWLVSNTNNCNIIYTVRK
ncbi:MAG: hypothetical protein SH818_06235 [Saprospiraceae bacterium]|nr:hypothetical protein [Saprospiraceae bacterium]